MCVCVWEFHTLQQQRSVVCVCVAIRLKFLFTCRWVSLRNQNRWFSNVRLGRAGDSPVSGLDKQRSACEGSRGRKRFRTCRNCLIRWKINKISFHDDYSHLNAIKMKVTNWFLWLWKQNKGLIVHRKNVKREGSLKIHSAVLHFPIFVFFPVLSCVCQTGFGHKSRKV